MLVAYFFISLCAIRIAVRASPPQVDFSSALLRQDAAALTAALANGADPDAYVRGKAPLFFAVASRSLPLTRLLLESGASVNAVDSLGDYRKPTVLHMAAASDSAELVDLLVRHGADVNFGSGMTHADGPPLVAAVRSGASLAVGSLLRLGADPNAESATGETLVEIAASRTEAVALILSRQLVDSGASRGLSRALCLACRERKVQLVRALVAAGADLTSQDDNGELPLHHAAHSFAVPPSTGAPDWSADVLGEEVARAVLPPLPLGLFAADSEGRTALQRALSSDGSWRVALFLLGLAEVREALRPREYMTAVFVEAMKGYRIAAQQARANPGPVESFDSVGHSFQDL